MRETQHALRVVVRFTHPAKTLFIPSMPLRYTRTGCGECVPTVCRACSDQVTRLGHVLNRALPPIVTVPRGPLSGTEFSRQSGNSCSRRLSCEANRCWVSETAAMAISLRKTPRRRLRSKNLRTIFWAIPQAQGTIGRSRSKSCTSPKVSGRYLETPPWRRRGSAPRRQYSGRRALGADELLVEPLSGLRIFHAQYPAKRCLATPRATYSAAAHLHPTMVLFRPAAIPDRSAENFRGFPSGMPLQSGFAQRHGQDGPVTGYFAAGPGFGRISGRNWGTALAAWRAVSTASR